ncbi:cytochrome P450 [Ilyonectria destructans]|nr:cytochrome P450 [Ilyonectria destructans]
MQLPSQSILLNTKPAVAVPALLPLSLFGYLLWSAIYNLFIHPLKRFPGPKSWAISRIPYTKSYLSGSAHKNFHKLHQKYGPIVRVAPDELSFTSAEAWKEIMGHRKDSSGENAKDVTFSAGWENTILGANLEDHRRYRRVLSNGFSSKAMQDQQPMMMKYVDLLLQRLHEHCDDGTKALDVVSWYNFTTFDIIGDLAFGESFGCLDNSNYHPWVSLIFQSVKAGSFMTSMRRLGRGFEVALNWLIPRQLLQKREQHMKLVQEKVAQRLAINTDRPDFMDTMVRKEGAMKMSLDEIRAHANVLILAGSETTATTLSGTTYLLCMHPAILGKLETEVRTVFKSESEIDLFSVQKLPYMLAVLDEAMRVYPPVPTAIPRTTPPSGNMILGEYLPGNVKLGIWQWAMNRDPTNFTDPEAFIPERWLGDPRFAEDKTDALQPFSYGPRNCIGKNLAYAESRLILARMIWNFDLKIADDSRRWIEDSEMYMIWQKNPLHVYLTPRKFEGSE